MLRFAPQRLIYELGGAAYFTLRGRGIPFLRAKIAASRELPTLLRKRKAILGARSISNSELLACMRGDWFGPKWRRFASVWNRCSKVQVVARPTEVDS